MFFVTRHRREWFWKPVWNFDLVLHIYDNTQLKQHHVWEIIFFFLKKFCFQKNASSPTPACILLWFVLLAYCGFDCKATVASLLQTRDWAIRGQYLMVSSGWILNQNQFCFVSTDLVVKQSHRIWNMSWNVSLHQREICDVRHDQLWTF